METNTGTQVWPFCSLPSNPHPLGCGLCKVVNVTMQHHSAVRWLSSPFCRCKNSGSERPEAFQGHMTRRSRAYFPAQLS